MNSLFMSLVSLSDKTRRKTDMKRQSNYLQPPFAHGAITSLLSNSPHRSISLPPFCDSTADGTYGPYDDDGAPE